MAHGTDELQDVGADLGSLLLERKIKARPASAGAVSRSALIERARRGGSPVVAITAPPGYGKSTMLAEWASTEDRAVAWADVDRLDDDPAALLTLLAVACSQISPEAAAVAAEMRGPGASMLGRSAPLLAAALARTSTPFVLFVDDLHEASSLACQDALGIVLRGVPDGSQVVLASRHAQPHLARTRVEGRLFEIGPHELRLDADGARMIFAEAGVPTPGDLEEVVARCEGWPTGLFLCALLVRDGGAAAAMSGDVTFVADYLYQECLDRLTPRTRSFLVRTAVLDQLSSAVCDAVLQTTDSAQLLRELESTNLFLVPLDPRRDWFRYHALFREFLLTELERTDADEVSRLHRRAATWFADHGLAARSVEHLLAAGDVQEAAVLVSELALPTYQEGHVATITRWLTELGDRTIAALPALTVVTTWRALLLGESRQAERWAAELESFDAGQLAPEDRLALESARCQIRAGMCLDGPDAALAAARFAVEHEPAWSPWWDQALHLLGSTLLLVGDTAAAREAFADAAATGTAAGNPDSVILSEAELALLDMTEGHWAEALDHARTAVETIEIHHMEGYSTTALALAVSARIALHRGERTAAERFLARAMRARVPCTYVLPFLAVRTRLQLGYAHVTLGERTTALHLAAEAAEVVRRRPRLGLLVAELTAFHERLTTIAPTPGAPPLTPAELRVLPYLQTHLTLAEIGSRLFVSRNTVSTQVASIYRKLGARSRGDAVERAAALGLLGA